MKKETLFKKDFLKELRRNKGWSEEKTANSIHISQTAYNHWECKGGEPKGREIYRLAKLFNVRMEDFYEERGTKEDD